MAQKEIIFLSHDKIDLKKWDHCINTAFNGIPYSESWYLDVVSPDWCALVQGDYERVMPLPVKKKYGMSYIIQPLFVQQLGVFSVKQMDSTVVKAFLNAIPKKYLYININLNTHNHLPVSEIKNLNHELDLIDSYDSLRSVYSKNLKRNLKKSVKASNSVMQHIRPEEIIRLFRNDRGRDVEGWGDKQYMVLQKLLYTGIHKNRFDTLGVLSPRNELIAAAVFLKSRKSLIFLFSGNSEEGKKTGAMPFLLDKYIQEHSEMHITLDFEGSNDENLARFYRSFGSTPIYYPSWRDARVPRIVKPLLFR